MKIPLRATNWLYLNIYVEYVSENVIAGPKGIFVCLSFHVDFQFSKVFALIYTLTNSVWEFQLLFHLSPTLVIVYLFHCRHSDGYIMASYCAFQHFQRKHI